MEIQATNYQAPHPYPQGGQMAGLYYKDLSTYLYIRSWTLKKKGDRYHHATRANN